MFRRTRWWLEIRPRVVKKLNASKGQWNQLSSFTEAESCGDTHGSPGKELAELPRGAVNIFGMLLKGWYYRMTCRIRGQRVRFGKNLRVAGPLDIRGPGTVVFGNDWQDLTRLTPSHQSRIRLMQ